MGLAVVGAGVGRTGTHSLKVALEQLLGGPCHHMIEVYPSEAQRAGWTAACRGESVDWGALLDGYRAIVDWPGASFWPELVEANPGALVLLSTRPAQDWYRSAANTIFPGSRRMAESGDPWMTAVMEMLAERFSDRFDDEDVMITAFERHNAAVRAAVPAERLLEWTASDGWGLICERLGVSVPEEEFPLTNTTEQFRARADLPPVE